MFDLYIGNKNYSTWSLRQARAWARSAAAEMHSGFQALRDTCGMNCGLRITLHQVDDALKRDLARLEALWADGLARFGGPWLTGAKFCAADAFFTPVAFRIQTYDPPLGDDARRYGAQLLALPSMQTWYAGALAETWRDADHEDEVRGVGVWREDLRARATP